MNPRIVLLSLLMAATVQAQDPTTRGRLPPAQPATLPQPSPAPNPTLVPAPGVDPGTRFGPCFPVLQAGGVIIDLAATAAGPYSVTLTWSGLPGVYNVSTSGPGAPFQASATLPPSGTATLAREQPARLGPGRVRTPDMSQTFPATLTHAPTLPGTQYNYTLAGTLADGRQACGVAVTTTAPAREKRPRPLNVPAPLYGWADLHTHPMSQLAFGGKLFHGAPDSHPDPRLGSLMPAVQMPYDAQCRFDVRAVSMEEALSDDAPTHGDAIQSKCGNSLRNLLVQVLEEANHALRQPGHAVGAPTFVDWPKWNDITHQKMWVDWIRRAKDGGLRVMVALSHNNRLLAEALGSGGPVSGVKSDTASSDLQVREIAAFVARHDDFMRVASSAAELQGIVQSGKIAVVLGVEIDNIGDFNDKPALTTRMIEEEIDRLYDKLNVRYILPIHVTDNAFGDTAIYSPLFNLANFRETGRFWTVGCAGATDEIGFESFNFPPLLNPFIPPGFPQPPRSPGCLNGTGQFLGHVNVRTPPGASNPIGGLTPLGESAIRHMMRRGMIIDIDHMSDRAVNRALQIAEGIQPGGGYPLMSGHSGIRNRNSGHNKENSRSIAQLGRIACLGGMFGLGTDGIKADDWANQYMQAFNAMSNGFASCPDRAPFGTGMVAFGTDTNSLIRTPRPTMVDFHDGSFPVPRFADIYNPNNPANGGNSLLPVQARSSSASRTWDYNTDGVAHYGMFSDFVKDVRTLPADRGVNGRDLVDNRLMRGADYFYRMWQKVESQKSNVR